MSDEIDQILQQIGELPPLPQAAQKALALIRDPKSSMGQVARVLSMDQVMTSLVLRWVNSAYYGLPNPVSTVQQAIMYLGQNTVQSLILAASVANMLYRPLPGYDLARGDLWRHAIGVANGARLILSNIDPKSAEEAYHAGLLCDIGKLALEVLLRNTDTEDPQFQDRHFSELEASLCGYDHAYLGGEMARRWNLPTPLVTAISFHHKPSQAGESIRLASAVHVADAAMMIFGIGIGRDGLRYPCDPVAFEMLGIREAQLEDLFDRMSNVVHAAEELFGMIQA
ncbi:MAG: HDOD domain-containing protein [Chloroflexi bacterium]|nr:HDOD domain-containing protein [Chloroflexota bacterium]